MLVFQSTSRWTLWFDSTSHNVVVRPYLSGFSRWTVATRVETTYRKALSPEYKGEGIR